MRLSGTKTSQELVDANRWNFWGDANRRSQHGGYHNILAGATTTGLARGYGPDELSADATRGQHGQPRVGMV